MVSAGADIVILNELAYERHGEQLAGKKLILLQSDISASLAVCEAPKRQADFVHLSWNATGVHMHETGHPA